MATRRGYNVSVPKVPTSKFVKSIDAIFYGIVLIPLVRCSFRCTLSLYNAFMWTVCLKAGQSELNDTRRNEGTKEQTIEQTKERTNTSRDLLKCIDVGYHDANNVSNFGGDPMTQLNFKNI